MNEKYIAGFFDGEGSAMVVTVKRKLKTKIRYRFRPTIKIAQKTTAVLYAMQRFLKFGTVVENHGCPNLIIVGGDNILAFVEKIAPETLLKKKQLFLLKKLVNFQKAKHKNHPYSKKDSIEMMRVRRKIFDLNCLTKSGLKQKYPTNKILAETTFVNAKKWVADRAENGKNALIEYQRVHKKPRKVIDCACGCEEKLEDFDSRGRRRKFIQGHNQKGEHWAWGRHENE